MLQRYDSGLRVLLLKSLVVAILVALTERENIRTKGQKNKRFFERGSTPPELGAFVGAAATGAGARG